MPAAPSPARGALLALLVGALGIAFAPIFVKLSPLAPSATAFWRLGFALPVLAVWLLAERHGNTTPRRPQGWRDYYRLSLAGLFFAGDLAVWHWSLAYTSVANATLLPNFAPVPVALAGWVLFGERFTRTFLVGLVVALAGAAVLMGESVRLSLDQVFGDALGLLTSLFYAGYILAVRRLRAEFSTATIMLWSGVISTITLAGIAVLSGETLITTSWSGWGVLVALGWISHAGGQSLIAYALAHLPAAFSSVSLLLQPAAAAVLAWPLLGEALRPQQALGATIILAGIALARRGSR